MMLLPPAGKILLLQQFLVTSKIMLNRLQTVDSSNLITGFVIVKDMLAYKVSVLDSGRRGLGSRPVAHFSVTTCQRAHTAVQFSFTI